MRRVWQGLVLLLSSALLALPESAQADPFCTNNFATGGTVSLITEGSSQYCVHRFTTGGTFAAQRALEVEYLIVGGGGGGGSSDLYEGTHYHSGGGGGAGGVRQGAGLAISVGTFGVVVGQGGTGGASGGTARGGNGENSSFNNLTANGGGGGGGSTSQPASVAPTAGGSGGGGGGRQSWDDQPATLGAAGITGQGNSGGNGRNGSTGGVQGGNAPEQTGGGGGGAAGAGGNGLSNLGGAGGVGITSTITGASVGYAGGGGGGHRGTTGSGGSASQGGGAGGGGSTAANPGNGAANTGGGGGGAGRGQDQGGNGGSGIVVIRYLVPDLPQADAGPDQSVGSGASATLDGSASVPVGQISYSWSQTAGPFVTLTGANAVTPSFTAPMLSACQSNALLTFSLVVTDSFGRASPTDTVTITVAPPPCQGGGIGGSEVNEYNDPNGEVTWRAHSFFENGTLTLSEPTDVEYLIVGGGGGGGNSGGANHYTGGGGGGGGVLQGTFSGISGSFPITVGDGGTGGVNSVDNGLGESGQDSSFNGEIAEGGGGGGGAFCEPGCTVSDPSPGGSGGGGGAQIPNATRDGATGTVGQGHAGGSGIGSDTSEPLQSAGGGGGAGGPGGNGTNAVAGAGGGGVESSITGQSQSYAGGGGGGKRWTNGTAGVASHGGGRGGGGEGTPLPEDGEASTGGGGGGAGFGRDQGGAGGSGIVVARYVINTRPTADAGPDSTALAFQEFTLDGTGTTDPDGPTDQGNIESYEWVQIAGTTVDLSDTSAISPTFTPEQPANGAASETLTFRLTVTDEFGLSHTDEVTITLHAVAVLTASKAVSVFSEDGSGCDDFSATTPEEPEFPAAIPGACIQYTIIVENEGPAAAQNVTLTDELPANLSFQAADLDDNWGTGTNLVTPSVGCSGCDVTVEDGVINANTTATLTIRAIVN